MKRSIFAVILIIFLTSMVHAHGGGKKNVEFPEDSLTVKRHNNMSNEAEPKVSALIEPS